MAGARRNTPARANSSATQTSTHNKRTHMHMCGRTNNSENTIKHSFCMRFHACTCSACTRTSPKIHKPPRTLRAKQCPRSTPLPKHVFVIITTNHAEAGSCAAAAQPLKPKHTFAARNICTPSWQSRHATSISNINKLHTKSRCPTRVREKRGCAQIHNTPPRG